MFGLTGELNDIFLPGFSDDHQTGKDTYKYGKVDNCWSLSIEKECDPDMVKEKFQDPKRAENHQLVNEICISMLADTTNPKGQLLVKGKLHTAMKAWIVHKPDISKGFVKEKKGKK